MNRDFNKKRPSDERRSESSGKKAPFGNGDSARRTGNTRSDDSFRGPKPERREFNQDGRRERPTSGKQWNPSEKDGKITRSSQSNETNSHSSFNNRTPGNVRSRFNSDNKEERGNGNRGFASDRRDRNFGNSERGNRGFGSERGTRSFGNSERGNRDSNSERGGERKFNSSERPARSFNRPDGERAPFKKDFNSRERGDAPNRREFGSRDENSSFNRRGLNSSERGEAPYKKEYNSGDRNNAGSRDFNRPSRRPGFEDKTGGEASRNRFKPADGYKKDFSRDSRPGNKFQSDRPNRFAKDSEGGESNFNRADREHKSAEDHFGRKEFGQRRSSFKPGGSRGEFGGSSDRFERKEGGFRAGSSRFGNSEGGDKRFSKGGDKPYSGLKKKDQVIVTPNYDLRKIKPQEVKVEKTASGEVIQSNPDELRLNRFISNAGVCSRRDADELIQSGRIKVNGKVVTEMGFKVSTRDEVTLDGKALSREKLVYVLLNKPKDHITTTDDPDERKTVMDLVKTACTERIYPVGRLDRNTTGLLLLTNDGELAEKLAHPANNIKKIYQVELDKPISEVDYEKIKAGLVLEDGPAHVDALEIISPDAMKLGIEIHIGKNRIVRRIFEHVGYTVVKLDRVVYAGLTKKDLTRGKWRYLSEKEIIQLKFKK